MTLGTDLRRIPPPLRKEQLVFYNSIHSYSQLILLPWGFQQETPDDYDQMY